MHFTSSLLVTGLMASGVLAAPAHIRARDDGMYHPPGNDGSYHASSYAASADNGMYHPTGDTGMYTPGTYTASGAAASSTTSSSMSVSTDDSSYPTESMPSQSYPTETESSQSYPTETMPSQAYPTGPASMPTGPASYSAGLPPFGTSSTTDLGAATSTASGAMPSGTGTGSLPGLDDKQCKNAEAIIEAVKEEGMGKQGCIIAITCALQESSLMNYANSAKVPSSAKYPHDIDGGDQDSIGLFQQKASIYTDIAADMDPKKAAKQFLDLVKKIPNWKTGAVNEVVQQVQKAEAGDLYAKRIPLATQVCNAANLN